MWFINIFYWLQAFAAPVILLGLIGITTGSKQGFYILLGIGVIAGIVAAEYIRRKFGLDTFFSSIYGSNKMNEKAKDKNQDKTL